MSYAFTSALAPAANASNSLLGGAVNSVGNVVNGTTGAVGNAVNNTLGAATGAANNAFGSTLGYNPTAATGVANNAFGSTLGYNPAAMTTGLGGGGVPGSQATLIGAVDPVTPIAKNGRKGYYGFGIFGYRNNTSATRGVRGGTCNNTKTNAAITNQTNNNTNTNTNQVANNQSTIYTALPPSSNAYVVTANTNACSAVTNGCMFNQSDYANTRAGCRIGTNNSINNVVNTTNDVIGNMNNNTSETINGSTICVESTNGVVQPALPEPWASAVNVITASQYLESAIHANNCKHVKQYLCKAIKHLVYAKKYLSLAANTYSGQSQQQYCYLADQVGIAIGQLKHIKDNIPNKHLKEYQSTVIYNFQGTLSSLYQQLSATW